MESPGPAVDTAPCREGGDQAVRSLVRGEPTDEKPHRPAVPGGPFPELAEPGPIGRRGQVVEIEQDGSDRATAATPVVQLGHVVRRVAETQSGARGQLRQLMTAGSQFERHMRLPWFEERSRGDVV